MSETFGQWLKARREERGLTLRNVEKIANGQMSNAYLSQLEGDRIDAPSVLKLHVLSAALGLDFADLCEPASARSPMLPTSAPPADR
jgi:transcriptional regulator with XRE-family HTH domain